MRPDAQAATPANTSEATIISISPKAPNVPSASETRTSAVTPITRSHKSAGARSSR